MEITGVNDGVSGQPEALGNSPQKFLIAAWLRIAWSGSFDSIVACAPTALQDDSGRKIPLSTWPIDVSPLLPRR